MSEGFEIKADRKIVLIDDEKSFSEVICFFLKKENFDVKCYNDPGEAILNIISDKPDLILLDLSMPNVNGFTVLEHIKKDLINHQYKIIIVTNLKYTDSGIPITEDFVKSIGADELFFKTGDLSELVEKIKKLLSV